MQKQEWQKGKAGWDLGPHPHPVLSAGQEQGGSGTKQVRGIFPSLMRWLFNIYRVEMKE